MRIRLYALAVATLPALLAAAALAQDNRPRDSSGAIMDLSKWHSLPTHEFMLNIVDLPNAEFSGAERRVRNKGIPHERVWFDNRRGYIITEHVYTGVYNEYVTDRMKSGEAIDKLLDLFGRNRGQTYEGGEKRKIYAFGDRAGWAYVVRGRHTSEACIIARLGFLTDWGKMGHRTGERYDTSFSFRDCSSKRSLDDVVEWLGGAKIVEPSYNRAGMK